MKIEQYQYHRFLDEAGDTTFFGRGNVPLVGTNGVSKCFILGMLKINEPLNAVRAKVIDLQKSIEQDKYYNSILSVKKRKDAFGFYLHAKDDVPEIRKAAFELINSIDCSFEAIVGRKIYSIYDKKHNGKEREFYADMLSHLLKNKLNKYEKLVLNISERSKCTSHSNLQSGLDKAINRSVDKNPDKHNNCQVNFNVQQPTNEPLLNLADYFCWAIQRVFEKGETRYYDFLFDKISLISDIYDQSKYGNKTNNNNFYGKKNRLTALNHLQ